MPSPFERLCLTFSRQFCRICQYMTSVTILVTDNLTHLHSKRQLTIFHDHAYSTDILMATLQENWLTEGLLDFEYKKYVLLAYMQNVRQKFDEKKLYPFLSDLVFHYRNLTTLRENKQLIFENFPKEVSRADFEKLQLEYKHIVEDDQLMRVIEEIVNFSLPKFKQRMDEGAHLYEDIAYNIRIEPIGISPLYKNEGYLLLFLNNQRKTYIYQYKIAVFNHARETFRGIHTHFLEVSDWSLVNTFERMKAQLIAQYKALPNPAAYLAVSKSILPLEETLLPITKRLLMQHIHEAA